MVYSDFVWILLVLKSKSLELRIYFVNVQDLKVVLLEKIS